MDKHQRREMQVVAMEIRAIAAETRAYGKGRTPEDVAKLESLSRDMETTAARLEVDAGGPLGDSKPATPRERKQARAVALQALNNTIAPDGYSRQMQKMGGA